MFAALYLLVQLDFYPTALVAPVVDCSFVSSAVDSVVFIPSVAAPDVVLVS